MKRANPYVVCPSHEIFQEAQSFGIPAPKLFLIPNGVDVSYFMPPTRSKRDLRAPLLWKPDTLMAIYVGRWAKGKGVEKILDLWEEGLTRPDFPWHLAMIFPEPPPEEISNRIKHLTGKVYTAEGVSDPLPYYQASDLAILLSEGEGMSNFLLEAMACGLPALATAASALPDTREESTGAHILSSNGKIVSDGLSFLIDISRQLEGLANLGRAARRYIEEKYAFDRVGQSYISPYRKMLD